MVNGNETPAQDAALETRSKALFDASVAELDGSTRSRLCQARHAASAQTQRRPGAVWWMPAIATAVVAALVALLLPSFQSQQPLSEESLADADDLTLLMNDESLDLLEEMEFYAWLAETDAFDNPAEPGPTKS
jgi:hypothetical protein